MLGYIKTLNKALKERVVFDAKMYLMNEYFNLEKQMKHIDTILNENITQRQNRLKTDYFDD